MRSHRKPLGTARAALEAALDRSGEPLPYDPAQLSLELGEDNLERLERMLGIQLSYDDVQPPRRR